MDDAENETDEASQEEARPSARKRSSFVAVRHALLLWPYVRARWKTMLALGIATVIFSAAEAGRTVLIDPLLNRVLMAKSDAGDRKDAMLTFKDPPEPELAAQQAAAQARAQARPVNETLADPNLSLPPPLPRVRFPDERQNKAQEILQKTRTQLIEVSLDLGSAGEGRQRVRNALAQGVELQRAAREALEAGKLDLAVSLSLAARKPAYLASFTTAWDTLYWVVMAASAFALVMSAGQFYSLYLSKTIVARIIIDIQNDLAKHLLGQELSYFEGQQQGELFSRLTNDIGTTQIALDVFFSDLVIQPFRLCALLVMAVYFSPVLSLTLIALAATVFIPIRVIGKSIRRRARRRQQSAARAVGVMQQMFSGIRTVKAFHREDFEAARFRERSQTLLADGISVIKSRISARSILVLTNNLTIPLVFLGGGLLLLNESSTLDLASFVAFVGVVIMMYMPAKQLAQAWTQLQDASAGIERVFELFDRQSVIKDAADAKALLEIRQGIRYQGVNFSYDGKRRVLHDINFEAPVGTQTAIVGGTGHGKSTLVDLLPRFIEPESGHVLIDGVDVRALTRRSLLDSIAIVTQDAFLFNDTIANNIRYGRLNASQEEVELAARKAQIHDEIQGMPSGYETIVGERGALLSGGQIQRVTIARALLREPKILILDEATSGLDTNTEKAVQAAFDELKAGRTAFVIAHRLSTIRGADQVLVIHEGRIIERGTYSELASQDGRFAALVRAQSLDADGPRGTEAVSAKGS